MTAHACMQPVPVSCIMQSRIYCSNSTVKIVNLGGKGDETFIVDLLEVTEIFCGSLCYSWHKTGSLITKQEV